MGGHVEVEAKAGLGLTLRALLREDEGRLLRLRMIGRGVYDGVGGRLGRRVEPVTGREQQGEPPKSVAFIVKD